MGSSINMRRVLRAASAVSLPAALLRGLFLATLLPAARMLTAQTGTQTQTKSAQASLPDGPGKDVVLRACVACHDLKVITSKRATDDEWAETVNSMVNRGALLSDDEIDEVIGYLAKNFKPVAPDQKQQPDLPPQK